MKANGRNANPHAASRRSCAWFLNPSLSPAGTPREIIDRLNTEVVKIMKLSETRERFAPLGADATPSTPQELAEFLRADTARWAKVIKDAGIPAE